MKILFVSRYVDPYSLGANKNVFLQALSLKRCFGINVEILTWPSNDLWSGPLPPVSDCSNFYSVIREDIKYHVFRAPYRYDVPSGGSILPDVDWEKAVEYGVKLLSILKPDIVHLHHRHGLWWILESAHRLNIATIYTNHDWGIACMRTVLVMGNKQLCNGIVEPQKCSLCIDSGRGRTLGRLNEAIVNSIVGEKIVSIAVKLPFLGNALMRKGIVMQNVRTRTKINYLRSTKVIQRLTHCFTPSKFGKIFFTKLGCKSDNITVLPWYHDPVILKKNIKSNQQFTITFIGRVSPEKGVDIIFSALEHLDECEPVLLRIAGTNDSLYCKKLMTKYPNVVGIHNVEWMGWSNVEPLFQTTDVTIIPSQLIDNTPLSLIESIAYKTPVIATRVPPIEELILEGETGFLADYGSVDSLLFAISRAMSQKSRIRSGIIQFPKVHKVDEYMAKVVKVYHDVINLQRAELYK